MPLNLAETSVVKSRSSVPNGANFVQLYHLSVRIVCSSSSRILLPQYLMNGLNSFNKTDREYSLARTHDVQVIAGCRGQIL